MAEISKLQKPVKPGQHPLVGWALLTYRYENGKGIVGWQGEIKHVVQTNTADGDMAIVDWFDWMSGGYTYSTGVKLTDLATRPGEGEVTVKMFPSAAERNSYYEYKHGGRG